MFKIKDKNHRIRGTELPQLKDPYATTTEIMSSNLAATYERYKRQPKALRQHRTIEGMEERSYDMFKLFVYLIQLMHLEGRFWPKWQAKKLVQMKPQGALGKCMK